MSDNPRRPEVSLQGSHPPNEELAQSTADSEKRNSLGDYAGSGHRADPSHAWARTHICKPDLQPGKLSMNHCQNNEHDRAELTAEQR